VTGVQTCALPISSNPADTGLVANGRGVTAYGLFVEHFQKFDVVWNGNGGKTIFFQNELPYDPPSAAQWSHDGIVGYAAYKVANSVTSHEAWGLGGYCVFTADPSIAAYHSFETPVNAAVRFHGLLTVSLGKGSITHVINDTGSAALPSNVTPHTVVDRTARTRCQVVAGCTQQPATSRSVLSCSHVPARACDGTGPVDARMVRCVGSRTARRVAGTPASPSRPSSKDTAARPACSAGPLSVVSGGWQKSAPKMSSQPTTLSRSGTSTPRSASRVNSPIASTSLNTTQAVAPLLSTASAAAAPDRRPGGNGPIRRKAIRWRAPALRIACQRAWLDHDVSGPET